MKKNILTKSVLGLAGFILIFSSAGFFTPKKAHAILGVGDIVSDLSADISDILINLSGYITSEATLGENIEDTVLNKVATAIAKELLMQVTESVVNWINSGFNGNPAFVQNPAAFFQNIGDQATGAFISQSGALSSLCSPFSVQVRLAIAQQQQQYDGYGINSGSNGLGGTGTTGTNQNQYSCTLSTAIQNGVNGTSGSIQGFTGGDFSQGGFAAFAALVTQPQNNPNGAFLIAEDQLQQQINNQVTEKQNELNQGGGFLSWESCTSGTDSDSVEAGSDDDPYGIGEEDNANENCQIQTPGSVISAALNKHLAVPSEELELADSINDVINAAFSQLVVVALQQGLTSVSKSANGSPSYLQNAVASGNSQSFASAQKSLLNAVSPYLKNAETIEANYSAALTLVVAASSTIGQAESCYQTDLNATTTPFYILAAPYLQNQINTLQNLDEASSAPLVETLVAQGGTASSTNNEYQIMYNQIVNAQTLGDLAAPNQTLTDISSSGGFPTSADIQTSQNDLKDDTTAIKPVQQQASQALNQCQSFNFSTFGTATTTH